jgi:DNA-3-methyladenine glycosylase
MGGEVTPKARRPLPRRFYNRRADRVARDLLGCVLFRRLGRRVLSGRIVETEAYVGEEDRACHARSGRTQRNAAMYGLPGHAYVYFVYGMYDMLNVVCQPQGRPEAVLFRALEPLEGLEVMRRLRGVALGARLTNGPGKLCMALSVTRRQNGLDLLGDQLWIGRGDLHCEESVAQTPRIGVDYAGPDAARLLRFHVAGNPHVSRRTASRRRPPRR